MMRSALLLQYLWNPKLTQFARSPSSLRAPCSITILVLVSPLHPGNESLVWFDGSNRLSRSLTYRWLRKVYCT